MNKVWVLPPREDWIVDRFVSEFNEDNPDIALPYRRIQEADVIWLLADWCWNHISSDFLRRKKVITTVHHVVPERFGPREVEDFSRRDDVTTVYHVYNQRTFDFIRPLTSKPIHLIKYWANQKLWFPTEPSREAIRNFYSISRDAYVVGSFQRDTLGEPLTRGVISPKLEKGPDRFCDAVIKMRESRRDLLVLLAGPKRQYVMGRLQEAEVPFLYVGESGVSVTQDVVNDLYNCLDLYVVTSRCEGGPQSLIECGLTKTPCVSTPVGIAEQVLPSTAISDDVTLATPAIPDVESWKLPGGYSEFRKLIASL